MGIYIKNYKKPQDCKKCIFYFSDLLCWAKLRCGGSQCCPLIEVPDHGDLIDRSELERVLKINKDCDKCIHRVAFCCDRDPDFVDACEAIYDALVVIQAERSEE